MVNVSKMAHESNNKIKGNFYTENNKNIMYILHIQTTYSTRIKYE